MLNTVAFKTLKAEGTVRIMFYVQKLKKQKQNKNNNNNNNNNNGITHNFIVFFPLCSRMPKNTGI